MKNVYFQIPQSPSCLTLWFHLRPVIKATPQTMPLRGRNYFYKISTFNSWDLVSQAWASGASTQGPGDMQMSLGLADSSLPRVSTCHGAAEEDNAKSLPALFPTPGIKVTPPPKSREVNCNVKHQWQWSEIVAGTLCMCNFTGETSKGSRNECERCSGDRWTDSRQAAPSSRG